MIKKIKKISWIGLGFLFMAPTLVRAVEGDTGSGTDINGTGGSPTIGTVVNPLKTSTLQEFIKTILNIVLTIGVPVIVCFIIYSGFLFVKAQGDPTKLKTAKDTFLWTMIGAAILLGAWTLSMALSGTVSQIRSGAGS